MVKMINFTSGIFYHIKINFKKECSEMLKESKTKQFKYPSTFKSIHTL